MLSYLHPITHLLVPMVLLTPLCFPNIALSQVSSTNHPSPQDVTQIPDEQLPTKLFHPNTGANNFDKITRIYAAKGNWFVIGSPSTETFLPIPSGWTTIETGSDAYILFSPQRNLEQPALRIRLGNGGYGQPIIIEQILSEFEREVNRVPNSKVLHKKMIDANKGYVFASVTTKSGKKRYLLQFFSKKPYKEGWFHVFSASADTENWNDYYPIVRVMVERWSWLNQVPIGTTLPLTLTP